MTRFKKRQLAGALAVALAVALVAAPVAAPAQEPRLPPSLDDLAPSPALPDAGSDAGLPADPEARLDTLMAELKEPGREDWEKIEGEINRIWSHSGSPAMDLLLRRGNEALGAEDYLTAVEHFSALVEMAPDFAEGWNARATTYYLMGEFSLSMVDIEHVLALEPRHFGALSGLGFIFEAMDEPQLALEAFEAVHALNPNRPNVNEAITRLERMTGAAEL
jgi:tetratricopeptide (TPR) repeat protein